MIPLLRNSDDPPYSASPRFLSSTALTRILSMSDNGLNGRRQAEVNEIVETMVDVGVFNAVKYAMTLRGIDCGQCRRPFRPLSDMDKMRVRAVLDKNLGEAL